MSEPDPPPALDQPAPDPGSGAAPAAPPATPTARARPKGLSGFTVSAMVVGSLFGCCGVAGVGGQFVNRAISPALLEASTRGLDEDLASAQRRMLQRNAEFQARVFPFAVAAGVLGLLHSLALLIAGIAANNARPSGRRMLELVCLIGLGVELVNGGFGLYAAREQSAISAELMDDAFAAGVARGPSGAKDTQQQQRAQEMARSFGAGAARVGSIMGMLMVIGFFAIKTGYYVACALYMRRKDVVEFFEHAATPNAAAG